MHAKHTLDAQCTREMLPLYEEQASDFGACLRSLIPLMNLESRRLSHPSCLCFFTYQSQPQWVCVPWSAEPVQSFVACRPTTTRELRAAPSTWARFAMAKDLEIRDPETEPRRPTAVPSRTGRCPPEMPSEVSKTSKQSP